MLLLLLLLVVARSPAGSVDRSQARFEREVLPILEAYCYDCHGDGSSKGEFALDEHLDYEKMLADEDLWETAQLHVVSHTMPPENKDQPTTEERAVLDQWINDVVFHVDEDNPDPGKVVVRRLNRVEYDNVVRDVFGVDLNVAARTFPPDDTGYGYDTVASVLTLPPLLFEKYLSAAEEIVGVAVQSAAREGAVEELDTRKFGGRGYHKGTNKIYFSSEGEATRGIQFERPGTHVVRLYASASRGGNELAKIRVRLGRKELGIVDVKEDIGSEGIYELKYEVKKAGEKQELGLAFINDYYKANVADRNLMIRKVELVRPAPSPDEVERTRFQLELFGEKIPEDEKAQFKLAREGLAQTGRLLLRRPLSDSEQDRFMSLYEAERKMGEPHADALRAPLVAMLVSPGFLFRGEPMSAETVPAENEVREIGELELASRLAFFLWSSGPDDRLLKLAEEGKLRKNLRAETERLLADDRSQSLVRNFGGQWLRLRDLDLVRPDSKSFPHYTDKLAADLREETERFLSDMIRENRSLRDLFLSEETWVNERLAKHYDLPGVKGEEFRKVSLKDTPRRGILGHGSVLVVTSHTTRTAPVNRGKFVLENLLGTPSPPAPQNIPPLGEDQVDGDQGTLREQLQRHRADPSCAACHRLLDPPGFALENFDASGRYREKEGQDPIDASGQLLEGETFTGLRGLTEILATTRSEKMAAGVTEQMFIYALGRGLSHDDRLAVQKIVERLKQNEYRFQEMIHGVIESVPFQKTKG